MKIFCTGKKSAIKPRKDMEKTSMQMTSERSQSEKATYCMIPTYSILEKTKLGRRWNIGGRQGEGVWGRNEQAEPRGLSAGKGVCEMLWWWVHITGHLSKPIECTRQLYGKLWASGKNNIDTGSSPVTDVPWRGADLGEEMHVWGQRDKGNLYFPLNFAADLKLLLKNNSLKIQKKKKK